MIPIPVPKWYAIVSMLLNEGGIETTFCINPERLIIWDRITNPAGDYSRCWTLFVVGGKLEMVQTCGNTTPFLRRFQYFDLADPGVVGRILVMLRGD